MGAKAPIFTRSLWSFRSFSWGDHSFTLISDLGLPISTVDLSPQSSAFRFPTSDCRFRSWTSALRGQTHLLSILCPQNAHFSAPRAEACGRSRGQLPALT